jgi:hypothetical protein
VSGNRVLMAFLALASTASAVLVAVLIANHSLEPIWIVGAPIVFSSVTGATVGRLTAPPVRVRHANAEPRPDEVDGP